MFVSYGSREVDPDINSYYYISPQTAHEWLTWRRSLRQFAQLVFQDNPMQIAAALKAAEPNVAETGTGALAPAPKALAADFTGTWKSPSLSTAPSLVGTRWTWCESVL